MVYQFLFCISICSEGRHTAKVGKEIYGTCGDVAQSRRTSNYLLLASPSILHAFGGAQRVQILFWMMADGIMIYLPQHHSRAAICSWWRPSASDLNLYRLKKVPCVLYGIWTDSCVGCWYVIMAVMKVISTVGAMIHPCFTPISAVKCSDSWPLLLNSCWYIVMKLDSPEANALVRPL